MALETSGIDRYDKMPLLVNRWLTQIHLVVPGGLSTVAKAWRGRPISIWWGKGAPWGALETSGEDRGSQKMNSILHFVAKPF